MHLDGGDGGPARRDREGVLEAEWDRCSVRVSCGDEPAAIVRPFRAETRQDDIETAR